MEKIKFKKKYGQNFLKDNSISKKIVLYSEIPEDTLVIEIGPGGGALTRELAPCCKQVLAYEIDDSLSSILRNNLKDYSNIDIIYGDFLTRNVKEDLKKYSYSHLYVIANLPYYITTPILLKLIEEHISVDKIVVMVQKEVGIRFSAEPGSRDYSSITVFFHYYFQLKKLFDVSKNCFVPKPNVDSVILSFTKKEEQLPLKNQELFFQLVRDAFQYKRKTLKNNLKKYNLNIIEQILSRYSLDLSVRAEALPLEIFVELSNALA